MGLLTAISKCASVFAPLIGNFLVSPCEDAIEGSDCNINGPVLVTFLCFAVSFAAMVVLPLESKGLHLK